MCGWKTNCPESLGSSYESCKSCDLETGNYRLGGTWLVVLLCAAVVFLFTTGQSAYEQLKEYSVMGAELPRRRADPCFRAVDRLRLLPWTCVCVTLHTMWSAVNFGYRTSIWNIAAQSMSVNWRLACLKTSGGWLCVLCLTCSLPFEILYFISRNIFPPPYSTLTLLGTRCSCAFQDDLWFPIFTLEIFITQQPTYNNTSSNRWMRLRW